MRNYSNFFFHEYLSLIAHIEVIKTNGFSYSNYSLAQIGGAMLKLESQILIRFETFNSFHFRIDQAYFGNQTILVLLEY